MPGRTTVREGAGASRTPAPAVEASRPGPSITLFLAGDVMTGRGIDQRLAHPSDPTLHEPWVKDARRYVALAEEAHGPIPRPMGWDYPWGVALADLERAAPAARVVNLETAVTASGDPWPGKGIHYRMHPENVPVLTAAGLDVCALANNHVLDWGRAGMLETLATLRDAGLRTAGAGADREAAEAPAEIPLPGGGRLLVFGLGAPSSGIPESWAAGENRPGVALLPRRVPAAVPDLARRIAARRRPGDLVVASVHMGGNWGWGVLAEERAFAHGLVDEAGVDLVHGHSSHHVRGIEVHRGKLVLYGCGDLVTDYEGIRGHERYRGDLSLLYLPTLHRTSGDLVSLEMVPVRMHRFRLARMSRTETRWLERTLDREGEPLGTSVEAGEEGRLRLRW